MATELDIATRGPTELDVPTRVPMEWSEGEYVPMAASGVPRYDGPYEASALFTAQSFATADKLMSKDFAVRAINYTEAPNEYGTTVTIGG